MRRSRPRFSSGRERVMDEEARDDDARPAWLAAERGADGTWRTGGDLNVSTYADLNARRKQLPWIT
jgi:hypothetical protein